MKEKQKNVIKEDEKIKWLQKNSEPIFFIVLPIIGLIVGFFIGRIDFFQLKYEEGTEIHLGTYKYINPLLMCETGGVLSSNFEYFKDKVDNLIKDNISNGKVNSASFYFRDLNNGPWFNINSDEKFFPASMLKVPAMITVLKEAENNPSIFSNEIEYGGTSIISQQHFKPQKDLEKNKVYNVSDLLDLMIKYSSNEAALVLVEMFGKEKIISTYSDLGIDEPGTSPENAMTISKYASFFRILFNSSYLSREMSEKALDLLTKTTFAQGIVAGVPSNIEVAHKFGEREAVDSSEVQLHDCGIVYYPNHPYLLCIMTRGNNFNDLSGTIKDISSLVYQEADRNFK